MITGSFIFLIALASGTIYAILNIGKKYYSPPVMRKPVSIPSIYEPKIILKSMAKPVLNYEYLPELRKLIQDAKRRIYIAMYIFSMKRNMKSLAQDLADAAQRGVDVRVILDQPSDPDNNPHLYKTNRQTIRYLKRHGANAMLDSEHIETHDKIVIIDFNTVLIGSHNLTSAGVVLNDEVSVLLRLNPDNSEYVEYFNEIWERCIKY